MRAIGFTEFGGPDVMQVLHLPEPHPGPGQVRIKVCAADINPSDSNARQGGLARTNSTWFPPSSHYVVGWDAAGVIDEVGDGVTRLGVGEAVIALVHPRSIFGAQAEFVVAPQESVVTAPAGATHAEASTLLMNAMTARTALDALTLTTGDTVAITGAAGAVGGYGVQLAKADGVRVIVESTPADETLLATLGADVIVPRSNDFAAAILRAHGPVDGVLDAALLNGAIAPAVRDNGIIFGARGFNGDTDRGITWKFAAAYDFLGNTTALEKLRDQAEDGTLTLRVSQTYAPEQAIDAHRHLDKGGYRGRLVFTL